MDLSGVVSFWRVLELADAGAQGVAAGDGGCGKHLRLGERTRSRSHGRSDGVYVFSSVYQIVYLVYQIRSV